MLGENTKMVTKEDVKVSLWSITEVKNTMFYTSFISVDALKLQRVVLHLMFSLVFKCW